MSQGQTPPGWYHAQGDPPGTSRYWDGSQWVGDPVQTGAAQAPQGQPGAGPDPSMGQPPGMGQPGAMGQPAGMGHAGSDYANTGFPGVDTPPGAFGGGPMAGQPQLASAGARIGGRVVDGIVWFFLGAISSIPLLIVSIDDFIDAFNAGGDAPDVNLGLVALTGLVNLALVVAYEVFLNVKGGTLGKRVISAKIVKEDGSPLDTNTAFMRMVPYLVVQGLGVITGLTGGGGLQQLLFFIIAVAGLIMLFTDGRRQTPWDKVGKTIVVSS